MSLYTSPKYDEVRNWIKKAREKNVPWKRIKLGNKNNEEGLDEFLKYKAENDFWEDIDKIVWKEICEICEKIEKEALELEEKSRQAIIHNKAFNNEIKLPTNPESSWVLYRKGLEKKGFRKAVIDRMEDINLSILRCLSEDTTKLGPIKGLVIGNVQSGKTANMAALAAMAADWGWNMIIVLSGTIDNLRVQTQKRLFNDLNNGGNLKWTVLENLSKGCRLGDNLQDLHLENSNVRYLNVCLKNSVRLKNLVDWINSDLNKKKQLKILLIDDEADQASVNTKKIDEDERTKINDLIVKLVHGINNNNESKGNYKAMNYVAYTATPYANILNDSKENSLYPKDFIVDLPTSEEYFGPQKIFGVLGEEETGLDIVRTIPKDEVQEIKEVYEGQFVGIPEQLERALIWFMCSVVAIRRRGDYNKPISMLIHTSQKQDHHSQIAEMIQNWFKRAKQNKAFIKKKCEEIYNFEIERFSIENFIEGNSQYPFLEGVSNYPKFNEIEKELDLLIDENISHILLDSENDLRYGKGIHLCIDNCGNNGITDDKYHVRLAYPEKKLDYTSAFIVIGGATLSRGLTIEGLVSTYFLRTTKQADTLMQMGRWFGYRIGYELYPRIWMTQNAIEQFQYLALMDKELREEIHEAFIHEKTPKDYSVKVMTHPVSRFITLTSKNKMQSAQEVSKTFSDAMIQTTLFYRDEYNLKHNLNVTQDFIRKLGNPIPTKKYSKHSLVFKNVESSKISEYLTKYKFHERQKIYTTIGYLSQWIDKVSAKGEINNWNVIIAGKSNGEKWKANKWEINKVVRTQKKDCLDKDYIDIGVLRAPSDLIADLDTVDYAKDVKATAKVDKIRQIREDAGIGKIPQLIIYVIDKNSKIKGKDKKNNCRESLNVNVDLVGICINIPRVKNNKYNYVSVKLDEIEKAFGTDMEE